MRKNLFALMTILLTNCFALSSTEKQYFAVFLDGHKIGYSIHSRIVSDSKVTTTDNFSISINRAGTTLSVSAMEKYLETSDGQPLAFENTIDMGLMKQTIKGTIDSSGKLIITGDQTTTMDWPRGALLNEGLLLLQKKTGLKPGTTLKAKVFMPDSLIAADANIVVGSQEKVDLLGRISELLKITTTVNLPTGAITETSFVDSENTPQKTIAPAMGMNVERIACDKHFALSPNDLVDFLDKTMVPSPVSLKEVSHAKSITYTLSPVKNAKLTFPITDIQTYSTAPDGTVTMTVRTLQQSKTSPIPYSGNDPNALAALKSTRYAQSDRKEIIELAHKAIGDSKDSLTAARRIESFVHSYINEKNFSVGYASALEVVKSKEGDCTEHAVLTAALCKAVGIPAQVAFGMLYVEELDNRTDVFGGHAWTRAYIGGKWIDLDATRPNVTGARITMAIGDGDPDQFFGILSTFGNFKIVEATITK